MDTWTTPPRRSQAFSAVINRGEHIKRPGRWVNLQRDHAAHHRDLCGAVVLCLGKSTGVRQKNPRRSVRVAEKWDEKNKKEKHQTTPEKSLLSLKPVWQRHGETGLTRRGSSDGWWPLKQTGHLPTHPQSLELCVMCSTLPSSLISWGGGGVSFQVAFLCINSCVLFDAVCSRQAVVTFNYSG